jgi:hypothetical protein
VAIGRIQWGSQGHRWRIHDGFVRLFPVREKDQREGRGNNASVHVTHVRRTRALLYVRLRSTMYFFSPCNPLTSYDKSVATPCGCHTTSESSSEQSRKPHTTREQERTFGGRKSSNRGGGKDEDGKGCEGSG